MGRSGSTGHGRRIGVERPVAPVAGSQLSRSGSFGYGALQASPEMVGELGRRIAIVRHLSRLAELLRDPLARGTSGAEYTPGRTFAGGETKSDKSGSSAADAGICCRLQSVAPPRVPGEPARLGQFAVRRLLGTGGMGAVWAADDLTLRRAVAIKVMLPHLAATPGAIDRFLREARSAAMLDHERVVPVFHVADAGGLPVVVMPLLTGEPLEQRLTRERARRCRRSCESVE